MCDEWFEVHQTPTDEIYREVVNPRTVLLGQHPFPRISRLRKSYSEDTKYIQLLVANEKHGDVTVERWVPDLTHRSAICYTKLSTVGGD